MRENAPTVGRAIVALLNEKNMKKADLQRKSRLSSGYISDLTNGKKRGKVTSIALEALARAFEMSPEELLKRSQINP